MNQPTATYGDGSKLGPCAGASGTCFEPADRVKGELARAQLYISTAYSHQFKCCELESVSAGVLRPWSEDVFKSWHQKYPPTSFELKRNELIYKRQGNRNPYIDHPEWAFKIEFNTAAAAAAFDPADDGES